MSRMSLISPTAAWAGSHTQQQQVRCICPRVTPRLCPGPSRRLKGSLVAASHAHTVLEVQPRMSDLLTETTGPVGTIAWKVSVMMPNLAAGYGRGRQMRPTVPLSCCEWCPQGSSWTSFAPCCSCWHRHGLSAWHRSLTAHLLLCSCSRH